MYHQQILIFGTQNKIPRHQSSLRQSWCNVSSATKKIRPYLACKYPIPSDDTWRVQCQNCIDKITANQTCPVTRRSNKTIRCFMYANLLHRLSGARVINNYFPFKSQRLSRNTHQIENICIYCTLPMYTTHLREVWPEAHSEWKRVTWKTATPGTCVIVPFQETGFSEHATPWLGEENLPLQF